jgi:hypothetical protein
LKPPKTKKGRREVSALHFLFSSHFHRVAAKTKQESFPSLENITRNNKKRKGRQNQFHPS